jgi:hypothetical protein
VYLTGSKNLHERTRGERKGELTFEVAGELDQLAYLVMCLDILRWYFPLHFDWDKDVDDLVKVKQESRDRIDLLLDTCKTPTDFVEAYLQSVKGHGEGEAEAILGPIEPMEIRG